MMGFIPELMREMGSPRTLAAHIAAGYPVSIGYVEGLLGRLREHEVRAVLEAFAPTGRYPSIGELEVIIREAERGK